MTARAILFSTPELDPIAASIRARLPTIHPGVFEYRTFPNGELSVHVGDPVAGAVVVILASLQPPTERLVGVLALADTVRRGGAARVHLVTPYFAYARHDRAKAGEDQIFFLLGKLIAAAGLSDVTTLDIHTPTAPAEFGVPLISLSTAPLFARALRATPFRDATLVAPDEGARRRTEDLARTLGTGATIVYGHKTRTARGVTTELERCSAPQVVLVDDILDTGGTLVEAARQLQCNGAPRIVVCVSHGLFTGEAWRALWHLGVERIYTTNSVGTGIIPTDDRIEIIPAGPIIAESIENTIG